MEWIPSWAVPTALGAQSLLPMTTSLAKPRIWLFKTEPEVFSIQDLANSPDQTTFWDGVRNYQARNTLRDDVQVGDLVLIHHSNADPPGIAGTARVVRAGYPDPSAFDPKDPHFDPKSRKESPTWIAVDIRLESIFPEPIGLPQLKAEPRLAQMVLLQRGSRLSIQPVTGPEWAIVDRMRRPKRRG